MPIYPDKKNGKLTGRWVVEVQIAGHRRRARRDTMAEAKTLEQEWRQVMVSGDLVEAKPVSSAEPAHLSHLVKKAAPSLWNGSEHGRLNVVKIDQMIAWTKVDPRLDKLGTFVDDAIACLRTEGRAPGTVNRYLSALHAVLKWGFKRGLVARLPEFQWQDEDEGRIRWVSDEEEERLLAAFEALGYEEIADFVRVALDTGCRRAELLHAERDQFAGKWLRLWETKNGHARSVPLTARAEAILDKRLPWALTEPKLRYAWDKAKLAIGLADDDDFVLHACRHTCATRLVEAGVNLRVVQQYMGHRAIQTTLRYAHVSDDTLADAAARITARRNPPADRGVGPRVGRSVPPKAPLNEDALEAVLEPV